MILWRKMTNDWRLWINLRAAGRPSFAIKIMIMRAYHLENTGAANKLTLKEHPIPEPGPREVLVRMHAVSLNRRDTYILNGVYPLPSVPGVIPVSDGAGEVVAIGEAVQKFTIGDHVAGSYFARWVDGPFSRELGRYQLGCTLSGMLTEYALLEEESLVHIPPHLSWEEAATLPCAGLTAWSALTGSGPITPGQTVLTIGTGGVALFALQFAKMLGAKVIAITSCPEKAARLIELGADDVINRYTIPNWPPAVRALTNGQGIDHIIETGGADTIEQSLQVAALNANVALVSVLGIQKKMIEIDPLILAGNLVTMRRLFVGNRTALEAMIRAMAVHLLHPVIDRVFPFDEAAQAYEYFAMGRLMGKVVIKI